MDKKRSDDEIQQHKDELAKKEQENNQMKQKIDSMADQFDCGICYQIMHQAVSLMPCLHTYCGGCFSDWMKRSKECPSCREAVIMVKKNSLINSSIESYLIVNPQLKRSKEDLEGQEKLNIFKNEIVSFVHSSLYI